MYKKIRVYDLRKYVSDFDFNGKKCNLFRFDKGIAILHGDKGAICFDDEGVGSNLKNIDELFEIELTDIPEKGKVYVMPQYLSKIDCKEIIENCEYKEMELTEFFTRKDYNFRLSRNFQELLRAINKIGLDSKDYWKGNQ